MKTREEVEKLKQNWRDDPCWDIYNTEGFQEYKEELMEYQRLCEKEWEEKNQKRHEELASKICPIITAGCAGDSEVIRPNYNCQVEKCAWWNAEKEKCSIAVIAMEKGI
jgi:hypothetical protein